MFSVCTWNVNSIRVRLSHLSTLCEKYRPDLILLQEIKCEENSFPREFIEELGYSSYIYGQKSYNGVAVLSKARVDEYKCRDIGNNLEEARYIEVVVNIDEVCFRIASLYLPNGSDVSSQNFKSKLFFLESLKKLMIEAYEFGDNYIIGGDFNVAPESIDVYDPIGMDGTIGFHESERVRLKEIFSSNYIDVWRALNPSVQKFTWWDYRDRSSYVKNLGMRLDHICISDKLSNIMHKAVILDEFRAMQRPSDHVPLMCYFDVSKL
ncbi:Exodeoxyribonuclease III [Candidatus Fokinia solitaria]|uniref:Exodeoxyribonuclease III n=1 Tax=Candidatus Fokinia solitaria TaxID=1802984 RepID=A0A2U8BR39_9RICK|nr:exodeoxyribonuclease III [Candidatus Fokinia solitaria]AWD32824.1 Exodeoxyribonuclease III [Candidatus Fokinia solitaria]